MSSFTFNGKPIGYYEQVMKEHRENCIRAINAGIITEKESQQITEAVPGGKAEVPK